MLCTKSDLPSSALCGTCAGVLIVAQIYQPVESLARMLSGVLHTKQGKATLPEGSAAAIEGNNFPRGNERAYHQTVRSVKNFLDFHGGVW
jgi:hypothetical protein